MFALITASYRYIVDRGDKELRRVYLDHNATTPVHPEALEAMLLYYREHYGNASSIHAFGRDARAAVDESREAIAKAINANFGEIYFTSGGTESDNLAIKGTALYNRDRGKHIITSSVEHHAVLHSCEYLEKEGFEVTYLPVDGDAVVAPDDLKKAIRDDTVLITLMHANNEVGAIQPVSQIGRIARERGIPFHTDAVQSFAKLPIDVEQMSIDLLSLSGHKIYGPKGIGVLYIREGTKLTPLSHGGEHEGNKRAGTENVPAIAGLGRAAELCLEDMDAESKRLKALKERLYRLIADEIGDVILNGSLENSLPNTLNLSFTAAEGESLIISLDLEGVALSSGSACSAGVEQPSHVLLAMGLEPRLAECSVRFSLGRDNTLEDIEYTASVLSPIVKRLREISVFA